MSRRKHKPRSPEQIALDRASACPEGGWQPIETAPKGEADILAVNRYGTMCVVSWMGFDGAAQGFCEVSTAHDGTLDATHWMPLPDPPTVKG